MTSVAEQDAGGGGRRILGVALTPRLGFVATLVIGTLAVLWIRTGFPAYIIAGARYDDALFVRLARFMLLGQWLGPFDNTTLVKGAGYPLFAALSFALGVPLKMAETILYLAVSAASAALAMRWSRSAALGSVLFLGLAFNPVLWANELARVIREGLYVSLTLAAVVLAVALGVPSMRSGGRSQGRALALAGGTGGVWAWFWLTREEGVWLMPSLIVAAAFAAWAVWRTPAPDRRAAGRGALTRWGVAAGTAALLVALVALANLVAYGRFETVEVKSAPFERAYGALYRVKPAAYRRLVVFPADVRAKVYAVSPAARALRPAFEGASGEQWRAAGCGDTPRAACPEILAGWFQWALRDAVAAAGHYRTAATAAAYYDRLADEVNEACDAKRLDCVAPRATLAPPFRADYATGAAARVPTLVAVYWREGLHVLPPNHSVVIPGEATSDPEKVMRMADFVGSAKPTVQQARWSRLATESRDHAVWAIASRIASLYALVLAVLVLVSPVGLFLLWRQARTDRDAALIALVAASAVGVVTRAALLTYLDVTSIPSVNVLYASPASPLLVLAAVLASVGGAVRWVSARCRNRTTSDENSAIN